MQIEQKALVRAPFDDLWSLVVDIPRVARCLPGAQDVQETEPGGYAGTLRVRVGAIGVRMKGTLHVVQLDREEGVMRLKVQAHDRRIGGSVTADATVQLLRTGPEETELAVTAEAAILGRLGQFGQAVMRKKSEQIMAQFVDNVVALLRTEPPASAAAPTPAPAAAPAAVPAAAPAAVPAATTVGAPNTASTGTEEPPGAQAPLSAPVAEASSPDAPTTASAGPPGRVLHVRIPGVAGVLATAGVLLAAWAAWDEHLPLALLGMTVVLAAIVSRRNV